MTMDQASFRTLTSVDRRTFLRAGLTAAGVGLVAGPGGLGAFGQMVPPRRFAAVRVSRERGRHTVRFGLPAKREKQNWHMNRNYLSPGYTTDITKLLRIGL